MKLRLYEIKKVFHRRILDLLIISFIFLCINTNVCNATPMYVNDEEFNLPDAHVYGVSFADGFVQSNRNIGIIVHKYNSIFYDDPKDFYFYMIEIWQRTDQNPFDVKSIVIMSEFDNVEIYADNLHRQKGLDFVTYKIMYPDTGKMNRLIEGVMYKMLIRIISTTGTAYDFYPSDLCITYAKRVAGWASR